MVEIWVRREVCREGGRGREERVWMLRVLVGGGEEVIGGKEERGDGGGEEEWRQVFVRWILGSRDEEGGT